MWDVDFYCVYGGFNGTAVSDEEEYWPEYDVSWLEGHASVIHNDSMDYDIEMFDCLVIIDGVTYERVDHLSIAEGDVAELSVRGRCSVGFDGGLYPHINGSLRIDNFLRYERDSQDTYQSLVLKGDDIPLRTIDLPNTGSGGIFSFFDQWVVEVTASPDATVEIVEPLKLPLYVEPFIIAVIVVLAIGTLSSIHRALVDAASRVPGEGVVGGRPPEGRR